MASRAQPTPFSEWWWTVDRPTLAALGALMLAGIVLCLAASPPVAARIGLDPFHFVNRQIFFLIPAALVMIVTSFLSPHDIRKVALVVFVVSLVLMAATPYFGAEIKGARRWLVILGVNIQPSEFMKPAFVVLIAWLFGETAKRPEMPANSIALALLIVVVALLVMQPDFGQTMLVSLVWGALFYMAGMRFIWVIGLAATAGLGLVTAFFTVPHVAQRINRFLDPASGDTFNIDIATESFVRGGWFGRGPGEGTIKRILPEGHTDFVFAVAAEEFGVVLCLILVALFAFIVIRALGKAMRTDDPFIRFASAGLAILFGLQSTINMAVNLHLMPAKGMTLPFVSYGGSSLISLAYGMGMLLALTRERPRANSDGDKLLAAWAPRNGRGARGRGPVLVAAGGTGGHLFPAEALAAALGKRGIPVHLVTDKRAARFGGGFADDVIHIVSSATFQSRNPIAVAKTLGSLACGLQSGAQADRPAATRGRHRLRRLSDHSAGDGSGVAPGAEPHSRFKRRHRPCQPPAGAARHRDRHDLSRHVQRRAELGGESDLDRQPAAAGGDRGGGDALPCARAIRSAFSSPAAAKAPASWPTSCPPRSAGSMPACAHGSPSSSRRATRI